MLSKVPLWCRGHPRDCRFTHEVLPLGLNLIQALTVSKVGNFGPYEQCVSMVVIFACVMSFTGRIPACGLHFVFSRLLNSCCRSSRELLNPDGLSFCLIWLFCK